MEVMSTETAIAACLAALVTGFLVASLMARKKQFESDIAVKLAQSTAEQTGQTCSELEIEHHKLQEQHRTLELSNNTLLAEYGGQTKSLATLENQQKLLEEKLSREMTNCHSAETEKQAAMTELAENKKAQDLLQARLSTSQSQLEFERNNVSEESKRNAELDKYAKGEEVKARETESKYQEQKTHLETVQAKYDESVKRYNDLTRTQTELKTALEERDKSHALQNTQLENVQRKIEALQEKFTDISVENSELKAAQCERDISHRQQLEQFEQQKIAMSVEFNNLANKIFEEKNRTFTDTSKISIDSMLQPFKEQIEGFQKRVNDIHDASIKGNEGISNQIKGVLDIGLKMSQEATNLASALKGDSQQRGAWGEAQLERTLEMSGLVENAHYEKQSGFKDLEGKQKKTDYLIKLPDNKHIIIDSKVSLVAYDRAVSAETPELQSAAMTEHINAVRKHIDDLALKDYTNLVGVHSPSFVLMFMPIEPAYIDALKSSKDLFGYGYSKNIVLVSHTTLIPILRTVANLWMMHRSSTEAREISEKAGDIYNQVCMVSERFLKLGNSLTTVKNHYNETVTALVGQQGLHGKVERFNQLSNKVSRSLPAIEPRHIDFETERLLLAAEPIEEVLTAPIVSIDN
jgi:DNA recombination protein RmuC